MLMSVATFAFSLSGLATAALVLPGTEALSTRVEAAILQAAKPSAGDVGWMAGCWGFTRNGRHVVEQWLPAEGGTLMGVSRTVANGKTTEYEFLVIRSGANGLEYVAKPSKQPETVFTATRVTATEAVFENPAHDFPKKIHYTRSGDALTAAIEGPMNGQNRRIEFPYTKAGCAAQ
jgi:hypothetical protein